MATVGNRLITKEMQWHSGMTEQNHLGMALLTKPAVLSGTMNRLFSSTNYFSDNPLSSLLWNISHGTETITQTEWEWELKGANRRPLIVVESTANDGSTPGKYNRPFKLVLDENWFVPGDILTPGTSDKKNQVRVRDQVVRRGNGWEYTVVMMTNNPDDFISPEYLKVGTKWSKLFSQYGEASEQAGSTQYSMPLALRNRMSLFRKKYQVTNLAAQEVLCVAIPDSTGKYHNSWISYAEAELWQEWYREMETALWYARSTDVVYDANGRPVRSGPGLQEQLEDGHVERYSQLTAKLLEEYLMDIFYGRVAPGQGRNIKAYTGEYGMIQFHRAIDDWSKKSSFIRNIDQFTSNVSSPLHPNAKQAGYQFVKVNMANGCTLELIHNPLYDDRTINTEIDPVSGYPVESQRITFLDFSGKGTQSNIKIMEKKDSFSFAYIRGTVGPTGPLKGEYAAHAGAYYEMVMEKQMGIHVEDVTKCGELILSRN